MLAPSAITHDLVPRGKVFNDTAAAGERLAVYEAAMARATHSLTHSLMLAPAMPMPVMLMNSIVQCRAMPTPTATAGTNCNAHCRCRSPVGPCVQEESPRPRPRLFSRACPLPSLCMTGACPLPSFLHSFLAPARPVAVSALPSS